MITWIVVPVYLGGGGAGDAGGFGPFGAGRGSLAFMVGSSRKVHDMDGVNGEVFLIDQ